MKRIGLVAVFLAFFSVSSGQEIDSVNLISHRNELGIDVTSLINQIFFINTSDYYYPYFPAYFLAYRYRFAKWSIRSGIGGNFKNQVSPSGYFSGSVNASDDTSKFSSLIFRVGAERDFAIGKRWQAYGGVDMKFVNSRDFRNHDYSNGGYLYGHDDKGSSIQFGPVIGFRFLITPRLSISSEASWDFYHEWRTEKNFYIPYDDSYPSIPTTNEKTKESGSVLLPPLGLFLNFNF